MSSVAAALEFQPARRSDLVIRPLGEEGRYVVKDPRSGEFFCFGPAEHFLLLQLDGRQSPEDIATAYERQFSEALGETDLEEFVELAGTHGFLEESDGKCSRHTPCAVAEAHGTPAVPTAHKNQSLLHWRKSLVNPDRFFTWLTPQIGFFWTRTFLMLSGLSIVAAALVLWTGRQQLAASFGNALRWDTALWAWLMVGIVTALHESAHGLTCKRYGGEVREIGFLLLFFMPCFYCNVSDAWLFKEKSKRLWVTFAGGYFELFLWSLAVFVWRVTVPESLVNHLAFVVLSLCGVQTLFNFNPLIKLDGYYLLSDALAIPNLLARSHQRFKGHLRRLLWGGAERPPLPPLPKGGRREGRILFWFGMASWCYSLLFLGLMVWGTFRLLGTGGNLVAAGAVALMGILGVRNLLKGVSQGEAMNMLRTRHKRTIGWVLIVGAVTAGLFLIEIEDRVGGTFQLRPVVRAEIRAPAAAFLKEVHLDEGDDVSQGVAVALLEIPDLSSRIAQKQGEMQEVAAQLRLLEIGARPEQLAEQRRKVERATAWRDLARSDLERSRDIFDHELTALEKQAAVREAELALADDGVKRVETLQSRGAVSGQDRLTAAHRRQIAVAQHDHARAERGAREAEGTLDFETELARREKDLAQTEGELALLEAGSRPEEIEAQRARLGRLDEEQRYLRELQRKVRVQSPLCGRVTTPRLREKAGQYLKEGDLICLIEDTTSLEAEIALSEEDAARIVVGSRCRLKTRALPYDSLEGTVAQIALAATPPCSPGAAGTAGAPVTAVVRDAPGTVLVRCRLELTPGALRPGMSGYARVYGARRPIGLIALDRALRFVRTEFWW